MEVVVEAVGLAPELACRLLGSLRPTLHFNKPFIIRAMETGLRRSRSHLQDLTEFLAQTPGLGFEHAQFRDWFPAV